jgi:RNA polymerase sigma-70 factor, ECF subfamily
MPPENWCHSRSKTAPPGTVRRLKKGCSWWKNRCLWVELAFYHLQAAIGAVHAQARTAEQTDWNQIAALYAVLPVIALNHAVAVAMSRGLETGLELIQQIATSGDLDSYYLYHAARADLLRRLRRNEEALAAYERALSLSANAVERRYLRRRMAELSNV